MSFAHFCGVNISPVAHLSYQCDIKHTVGKRRAESWERALACPCTVLPYVIHCIPAAWRLGCWGHGTGLLLTCGVHAQTAYFFPCFTCCWSLRWPTAQPSEQFSQIQRRQWSRFGALLGPPENHGGSKGTHLEATGSSFRSFLSSVIH